MNRRRYAFQWVVWKHCSAIALGVIAALGSATAQSPEGHAGAPTKSRDQERIHRQTVPEDFETHIYVADTEGQARAQMILELYEVLATDPTIENVSQYVAPGYIQHSSMIPNGPQPLAMLFSLSVSQYPAKIDVHRVAVVGDFAMAHVNFRNLDNDDPEDLGIAAVDMYLFGPDGMIVEHWDVLQDVPSLSTNTNGMFLKLFEGVE